MLPWRSPSRLLRLLVVLLVLTATLEAGKRKHHTKRAAKASKAAGKSCTEDTIIRQCTDGTDKACATVPQGDGSCNVIPFLAQTNNPIFYLTPTKSSSVMDGMVVLMARNGTTKLQYVPPGLKSLEIMRVASFEMVDLVLPDGLQVLAFRRSKFPPFPSSTFGNITLPDSMEKVIFDHTIMSTFDPSPWRHVPFKTLTLDNNRIRSFDNVVFPPSLTTLQISNNKLSSFTDTVLPPSCISLQLQGNNLPSIDAIPMSNFESLKYLTLTRNPIVEISDTTKLPRSLQTLKMDSCRLERISPNFSFPPNLTTLDLSNNALASFPATSLPTTLKSLSLVKNPLTEFNIDDSAVLKLLQQLTDFDADTSRVKCGSEYTKTTIQDKIYACVRRETRVSSQVSGPASLETTKSNNTMAIVLIVVGCVAAVTLLLAFLWTKRRRNRLADQLILEPIQDIPMSGMAAAYQVEETKAPSFVATTLVAVPTFFDEDLALRERFIPADMMDEYLPLIGNIYSGVLRGQRVMIMALPNEGQEETAPLLVRVVHPNLLTFYGFSCGFDNRLTIVTEWMDGGNLQAILEKPKPWNLLIHLSIAQDVAQALVYLHETIRAPHSRLSSQTIWINGSGQTKLSLRGGIEPAQRVWTAPECGFDEASAPSLAADVYAFGVLLLTLWKHAVPTVEVIMEESQLTAKRRRSGRKPKRTNDDWSPRLRDLAAQCLQRDRADRPSMKVVDSTLRSIHGDIEETTSRDDISTILGLSVLETVAPAASSVVESSRSTEAMAVTLEVASTVLGLSVVEVVEPESPLTSPVSTTANTVAHVESVVESVNSLDVEVEIQSELSNISAAVAVGSVTTSSSVSAQAGSTTRSI
ncbi:hypothetical protein AeRB84_000829 [Aphanomyces euteiches]|nr:hypothetical protein AeRB84_000829 [Aphanomyces euteiches]